MQLFQLKQYNVIFEPITMTIEVFAKVRDKNKDENLTVKEMSFMWFFADIRSDFASIIDDNERMAQVRKSIALPEGWKISKELKDAIEYYIKHSVTASSGLYTAAVITAKYIQEQLTDPVALLEKLDGRGNPIYKIDTLLKMLKDLPDVMARLHEAREQVIKELEASNSLKGNKKKSLFEDGI